MMRELLNWVFVQVMTLATMSLITFVFMQAYLRYQMDLSEARAWLLLAQWAILTFSTPRMINRFAHAGDQQGR